MNKKHYALLLLIVALIGCKKKNNAPNYTNFKILKVTIIDMPFTDSQGNTWDILSGSPDVYFNMEGSAGTVLYDGSVARRDNITANELPLSWDFLNAYTITNLNATHFVTVYDYDPLDTDDQIGYVGFTMSEHKNKYPKTITKTSNNLTIQITGEWY